MKVYQAINGVSADLAKEGIAKNSKNQAQGFAFRGIDAVYNALAPSLVRNGLVMLPRMVARTVTERTNKNGTALFYVTVEAEFDLVAAEDGSAHTVRSFGEAMDSGDKATNKAMSAAYKYAAFQTFCIPTEGDNDADATTHEVVAEAPTKVASPAGFDKWLADMEAVADEGTEKLYATWKKSDQKFRDHITATNVKGWEAIKAKAAKATAQAIAAKQLVTA